MKSGHDELPENSGAPWTSSENNWLAAMMRFADTERSSPLTMKVVSAAAVDKAAAAITRALDPDRDHSGDTIPSGITG